MIFVGIFFLLIAGLFLYANFAAHANETGEYQIGAHENIFLRERKQYLRRLASDILFHFGNRSALKETYEDEFVTIILDKIKERTYIYWRNTLVFKAYGLGYTSTLEIYRPDTGCNNWENYLKSFEKKLIAKNAAP